jgi:hypothetical protein
MRSRAWPLHLLLAGFVAAACIYMAFLEPWGHDTWFHLQRLQDVEQQLGRGQLRMHFAENAAQGKGIPVWVYYSQWVYWPALLPRSLGVSPLVSLKLVYCVFLTACCVGCYRLLELEADEHTAVFGTLLFVTSNYVIGEIFQRSAYAEFLSVALLPLLLVAVQRTLLQQGGMARAALVLVAGLMILFHPLSFMNAGYAIAAYALYIVVDRRMPYLRLMRLLPLFALALALTAFYWLPAVMETRYVMGAEGVPTPLRDTFLTFPRYVNFSSITNLGFVLTASAAAVAAALLRRRWAHVSFRSNDAAQRPSRPDDGSEPRRRSWPLVAGILVCVFLTLRISEPLYDRISFLAANLWVWRVLFPLTLLVTIFVIANLGVLPRRLRSNRALAAIAGLAILQAMVFVLWNSAEELSARRVPVQEIEREVAVESQRKDGFGIDEYLPNPRMLPRPDAACRVTRSVAQGGRYRMSFVLDPVDADACIHIPRYWHTRYTASIDGHPIDVYADAAGEIVIAPHGRSGVFELRFTQPAYVRFSNYLSSAAAVLLLIALVRGRSARRKSPASQGSS